MDGFENGANLVGTQAVTAKVLLYMYTVHTCFGLRGWWMTNKAQGGGFGAAGRA